MILDKLLLSSTCTARYPFINHKTYYGTSICIQNGFYKNFTFLPIMVDSRHAIQYQIAFILRMMPLSLCTQIMNRIYEVISNLWHSKSPNAIYVKCTSLVLRKNLGYAEPNMKTMLDLHLKQGYLKYFLLGMIADSEFFCKNISNLLRKFE